MQATDLPVRHRTPTTTSIPMTFRDRFCQTRHVSPKRYRTLLLNQSLYPAARLLRPFLLLKPNYFSVDYYFINKVGELKDPQDFEYLAQDYLSDVANWGVLRVKLNLRVSITRLRKIVKETMASR